MATKKTAGTTTSSKKAATKQTAGESGSSGGELKAPKAAAKKAAAPKAEGTTKAAPTHAEIAHLAHRFWEERGGHHGSHVADWIRAERELRGE